MDTTLLYWLFMGFVFFLCCGFIAAVAAVTYSILNLIYMWVYIMKGHPVYDEDGNEWKRLDFLKNDVSWTYTRTYKGPADHDDS